MKFVLDKDQVLCLQGTLVAAGTDVHEGEVWLYPKNGGVKLGNVNDLKYIGEATVQEIRDMILHNAKRPGRSVADMIISCMLEMNQQSK